MSKLSHGTVQFGINYGINNSTGVPDDKQVTSILDYAFKNGINTIDTAIAYGNSEGHELENTWLRFEVKIDRMIV